MAFRKHIKNGYRSRAKRCDECGYQIVDGDVFFSKVNRRAKVLAHLCAACYNKKFI